MTGHSGRHVQQMFQSFLNWLEGQFLRFNLICAIPQGMTGVFNVVDVDDESIWTAKIEEAKVVVDFTATWCGPCRMMAPVFLELSMNHPELIFLKVDVDRVNSLSNEWEVRTVPTFLFIKDGEQLHRIVGGSRLELERKCQEYASSHVPVMA